jgi:hypothetical protein
MASLMKITPVDGSIATASVSPSTVAMVCPLYLAKIGGERCGGEKRKKRGGRREQS